MAKKSRLQTFKDWLVVIFCLFGLIFFVIASADHISNVRSRQLSKPKTATNTGGAAKPITPAGAEAASGQAGPTDNELATLFSGASSLALIMFSLLLALAAIVGWQSLRHDVETVKDKAEAILEETEKAKRMSVKRTKRIGTSVRKRVNRIQDDMTKQVVDLASSMEKKYAEIEKEIRGRADAVTGNLIGTLHSVPTAEYQSEDDQAYLMEAVHHAQHGFEGLKDLPGNGKYMALNNLVYYTCLLRQQGNREETLSQAKTLRDIGKQYKDRPYAAPYLMTYARVMLVYGTERDELLEALGMIQGVLDMGITKLSRREAEFIERSLLQRLAQLSL